MVGEGLPSKQRTDPTATLLATSDELVNARVTLSSPPQSNRFIGVGPGFFQREPRIVTASIVAERCFVDVTSLKFLDPELYLWKDLQIVI